MALWGNNDNVGSAGTVSLNYATATVTGTGTSFGIAGGCSEGDVIRFGSRGSGNTFFGDAVIVSIANSESLTIGSTMGLTGAAIAGAQFTVSQLPKSSVLNIAFSRTKAETAGTQTIPQVGSATTNAGVGTDIVETAVSTFINANDFLINDGNDIIISTVATDSITLGSTISAGIATGEQLRFKRREGGYDAVVYGVENGPDLLLGSNTQYNVDAEGWVGVTTYIDNEGNLRVKKETLVAMSGITTSTAFPYPTPE